MAQILGQWFEQHRRPLPFRQQYHPYECWIAEVIFQQTRIEQGMPYYHRFLNQYPTIHALANASEKEVLKLWQGLGYYRRAQNLLAGARQIVEQHQGIIPSRREDLLKIRGIGPYIAAALRAIAFNEPDVVVDGNVRRVISRWFGMTQPVDTAAGTAAIRSAAHTFLEYLSPRRFNEAIMEFGALQCTPTPKCNSCPIQQYCIAHAEGNPDQYPIRKPRKKPRPQTLHCYHLTDGQRFWVVRRPPEGIWQGLYLFPHYFTPIPSLSAIAQRIGSLTHVLTHRRLHVILWHAHLSPQQLVQLDISDGLLITYSQIVTYPMPRLMEKLLEHLPTSFSIPHRSGKFPIGK